MGKFQRIKGVFILGLLAVLIIAAQPVSAVNGTISIAYRGSGGNYLGDVIVFDGYNSFGNVTLLKMTGPGLPPEGVPVYDMNGQIGSGNTVPVNQDGSWKFVWYTSTIKGQEKLQTARYYITAFDLSQPEKTSTTSLMLKLPDFYVNANPNSATDGDYVQLTGSVEKGTGNIRIDIADSAGKIIHSYDTSVSASGYYNIGFHVDMPPGIYSVILSSPSTRTTYRNYLTINPAGTPASVLPTADYTPVPSGTLLPVPGSDGPAITDQGTGTLSVSSVPLGATLYVDSIMVGSTPMEMTDLASGNHLVEIKAPGYQAYSAQVLVNPNQTTEVSPTLLKTQAPLPLSVFTILAGVLISLALVTARAKYRRP